MWIFLRDLLILESNSERGCISISTLVKLAYRWAYPKTNGLPTEDTFKRLIGAKK